MPFAHFGGYSFKAAFKHTTCLAGEAGPKFFMPIFGGYGGHVSTVTHGTAGANELTGTDAANRIHGGRGDDTIDGRSGNDLLRGGRGDDTIFGGSGNDRVSGGRGDDELAGHSGNDNIRGGRGQDDIFGGLGNDHLRGGRGDDAMDGGGGNDRMFGGRGDDDMRGGTGDDRLEGGRGDDRMRGGDGDDQLHGGRGNDHITGADGDDHLRGGSGDDKLADGAGDDRVYGGRGDDSFIVGEGNDRFDGGIGDDVAVFRGNIEDYAGLELNGARVHKVRDIDASDGDDGLNHLKDIEIFEFDNATFYAKTGEIAYKDGLDSPLDLAEALIPDVKIEGTGGDDWLNGTSQGELFDAGAGNDWQHGKVGDDVLVMGEGDDKNYGGAGFDIALFDGKIADFDGVDGVRDAYTVVDLNKADGDLGVDHVRAVELFVFEDAIFDTRSGETEIFADSGARDQRVEDLVNQADVVT